MSLWYPIIGFKLCVHVSWEDHYWLQIVCACILGGPLPKSLNSGYIFCQFSDSFFSNSKHFELLFVRFSSEKKIGVNIRFFHTVFEYSIWFLSQTKIETSLRFLSCHLAHKARVFRSYCDVTMAPIFCQLNKFKSLKITTYKSVYSNKAKLGS